MLSIYWAALGLGGVFVLLTTFLGADSDSDGDSSNFDGVAEFDAETDFGHGDPHTAGPSDGHAAAEGPGVLDILFLLFSIRFWAFFIAFFGLSGVGLSTLRGTGVITLVLSLCMGLFAGYGVSYLFKYMSRSNVSTDVSYGDMVGQVAKVLLPITPGDKGKVRIIVKGQTTDMAAYTEEGSYGIGEEVVVVRIKEHKAYVVARSQGVQEE